MLNLGQVRRIVFAIALGVWWLSVPRVNAEPITGQTPDAHLTPQLTWQAPPTCPAPKPLPSMRTAATFERGPSVVVVTETGGFGAVMLARWGGHELTRRFSARTCDEINGAVLVSLSLLDAGTAELSPVGSAPETEPVVGDVTAPSDAPNPAPNDASTSPPPASNLDPGLPATLPNEANGAVPDPTPVAAETRADSANAAEALPRAPAAAAPKGEEKTVPAAPSDGETASLPLVETVGLVIGAGTDSLQWATAGVGGAVSMGVGAWRGSLQVTGSRSLTTAAMAGVDVQVWLGEPRLQACHGWNGTLRWAVCAAGFVTFLRATATNVEQPTADWTWLPGAGLDGEFAVQLTNRWEWVTRLELSVRAHRADLFVEGRGKLVELGPVAGRVWLGPRWTL